MQKNIYYNAVIVLLLLSYMLVGVGNFLESLTIFGFRSTSQQIEQAKSGPLTVSKVCFTQYKHIPTTVKVEVPSPAICIEPESYHLQPFRNLYTFGPVIIHLDPLISLYFSRAPPLV